MNIPSLRVSVCLYTRLKTVLFNITVCLMVSWDVLSWSELSPVQHDFSVQACVWVLLWWWSAGEKNLNDPLNVCTNHFIYHFIAKPHSRDPTSSSEQPRRPHDSNHLSQPPSLPADLLHCFNSSSNFCPGELVLILLSHGTNSYI